jgi:hypothetical protein
MGSDQRQIFLHHGWRSLSWRNITSWLSLLVDKDDSTIQEWKRKEIEGKKQIDK